MNKKIFGIALVFFTFAIISSVFAAELARVSFDETTVWVRNPNPAHVQDGNKRVSGPRVSGIVCITIEHPKSGVTHTRDEEYDVEAGKEEPLYRLRSDLIEAGWIITGASTTTCYVIPSDD